MQKETFSQLEKEETHGKRKVVPEMPLPGRGDDRSEQYIGRGQEPKKTEDKSGIISAIESRLFGKPLTQPEIISALNNIIDDYGKQTSELWQIAILKSIGENKLLVAESIFESGNAFESNKIKEWGSSAELTDIMDFVAEIYKKLADSLKAEKFNIKPIQKKIQYFEGKTDVGGNIME